MVLKELSESEWQRSFVPVLRLAGSSNSNKLGGDPTYAREHAVGDVKHIMVRAEKRHPVKIDRPYCCQVALCGLFGIRSRCQILRGNRAARVSSSRKCHATEPVSIFYLCWRLLYYPRCTLRARISFFERREADTSAADPLLRGTGKGLPPEKVTIL